jgi:hypothetical protein
MRRDGFSINDPHDSAPTATGANPETQVDQVIGGEIKLKISGPAMGAWHRNAPLVTRKRRKLKARARRLVIISL